MDYFDGFRLIENIVKIYRWLSIADKPNDLPDHEDETGTQQQKILTYNKHMKLPMLKETFMST